MATVSITEFVTLDGVVQAPGSPGEDRSGGFAHGGWAVPGMDDEGGRVMAEIFAKAEAFLFGRRTFELFAAYWPKLTDPSHPIARPLNALPKYVVSRSLKAVEWHNSHVIADPEADIAQLRGRFAGEIQIHGSGGLAQTLMAKNLIDTYRIIIHPVVIGSGRKFFADGTVPAAMTVIDSRSTKAGITILTLKWKGAPTYGSF